MDLLADLDDLPSDEEYFGDDAGELGDASSSSVIAMKLDNEYETASFSNGARFQLLQSKAAKDVLEGIAVRAQDLSESKEEKDDSYRLVVSANQLAADIDGEMHLVHKHVRDLYCKAFPELEGLVPNANDYIRTVKTIGRNAENVKQINSLDSIISASQVMMVVVAAATTSGQSLTESEWIETEKACNYAYELDKARKTLLDFVTSRMNTIAPNLSILVGSSVAARLMGSAGGLLNLSRMPAGNIPVLGSVKRSLAGFSASGQQGKASGAGYLYQSDLVLGIRPDLRVKVQRILAGK